MRSACVLIAWCISVYSLWAWWEGDWRLAVWESGTIPISPSTALLLLLLTVALAVHQRWPTRPPVQIFLVVVAAITSTAAIAGMVQNLAGWNVGWEEWLAGSAGSVRGIPIGRMSPFTAAVLMLVAFSLLTLMPGLGDRSRVRCAGRIAAAVGGGFGAITALAYVTSTPLFYGGTVVPMAHLTAIALTAICLALALISRAHEDVRDFLFGERLPPALPGFFQREETLVVALTAGAIVAVGFIGPLYLRTQQNSLKNGIAAELTAIATLKVTEITTWREERLWDARRLMRTPYLARGISALAARPDDPGLRAELRAWVEEMNSTQDFTAVVLFDREMKPIVTAPPSAEVSGPMLRRLLQSASDAHDVLEADLHRGPNGAIHIDLVAPILSENEPRAIGAVLLRLNPQKLLYPLLHGWPVPSATAETLLFRREGNEFLYLNNPRHDARAAFVLRGSLDDSRLLETKVVRDHARLVSEDVDYRGVPVLGVGRPVPGTSWFIVAKIDQAEAYGPLRREALMVAVATIAMLCTATLSAGLLLRQRKHALLQREFELERERRALAERLALVTRHANDIIFLMDAEGRILEANDRALASYGFTLEELQQLPPGGLRENAGDPEPDQAREDIFHSPPGAVFEKVHRRKDGSLFPVEVSGSTFEADGRRFNLGIYRDISQRKAHEKQIARLTRLYSALSHINQTIVRATDRNGLFDAICRILVEFGGFKMAWIGWREAAGPIIPVASAGDSGGALQETWTCGDEQGPTLTALREDRTDVWTDLAHEPAPAGWRPCALRHGFRAAIALPIRREGRVAGVLTVYAAEPDVLGDKEIALLQEAATDVSFALDNFEREALRRQAKAALRRSEEEHRLLFANHPIPMWVCDAQTLQYIAVNNAAIQHYGYTREEFLGMTIRDIRPESDVPALLATMVDRDGSRRQVGPVRHRKKSGEIVLVEISSEPVTLEGRPARLVLAEDVTERHRAEEALRASERRYRSLFVNLVEGFAYCRMIEQAGQPADFVFLEVNPAFSSLTGLTDVVGRKVSEIIPGIRESDPELFERFGRVTHTGRAERFEIHVAGLKMWFDFSVYRAAAGCFVAVFDVITGRKHHEEQLALLNTALLAAPDCVVITDEHGAIEWVNPAFTRSSGYSFEEVIGRKTRILKSGMQSAEFYADLWRTITSGRNWHGEFVNRRKDGRLYTEHATIAPVRDAGGTIRHFVAIKHDITLRKQSERRLREQAELLDKANDAIVVSDLGGRITFWNHAAARLFGWSAAEILGEPVSELYALTAGAGGATARAAWTGDQRRKLKLRNRSGDPLTIEVSITVLRDEAGHATGYLGIGTDITEREKLEEKFLRSQRLESIGMLAAGITHDLNNVLAPIGMVSALLRPSVSGEEERHLLDTLDKCAGRGAGLVRQILGFVHGIGGELRVLQVKHLLRDIVDVVRETYPKSIVLADEIASGLWPISANPTQIHQVLLNLCVNARDAMPGGGRLRLRAYNCVLDAAAARALPGCEAGLEPKPGRWLVLEVGDTGSGIPPELLTRIWAPFFTTKPADKGTGLGLATVRGIIEAHHGFIALETAVGRGSTFRVFLPAEAPEGDDADSGSASAAARGRGELLLLVDDEEMIRNTAKFVLTKAGYRVVTACDGAEGAKVFDSHTAEIALVITDLDMPNLDGAGLARLIHDRRPSTPVLTMSGAGSSRRLAASPRVEFAADFLAKPFTTETLLCAIERLLPAARGGVKSSNPDDTRDGCIDSPPADS